MKAALLLQGLCGIYQWRNTATGKVYIGSSQNCARRKLEHRSRLRRGAHTNAKLQASWNKHGEAAFVFEMLFSVFDRDDLEQVEQQFLDDNKVTLSGYNLAPTAGNTAGWKAGDETRRRMSEAAKRRDNSAQVKAMAEATRGKKRPQHVVQAMQAGRKANPLSEASRAKMASAARARSRYTEIDRLQMVILSMEGNSLRAIGAMFGAAHQNVSKYIRDWRHAH